MIKNTLLIQNSAIIAEPIKASTSIFQKKVQKYFDNNLTLDRYKDFVPFILTPDLVPSLHNTFNMSHDDIHSDLQRF